MRPVHLGRSRVPVDMRIFDFIDLVFQLPNAFQMPRSEAWSTEEHNADLAVLSKYTG